MRATRKALQDDLDRGLGLAGPTVLADRLACDAYLFGHFPGPLGERANVLRRAGEVLPGGSLATATRQVDAKDLLVFAASEGDTGFKVWKTRFGNLGVGVCWDQWFPEGARLTALLPDGRAAYDGRATAEENWFERTGLAESTGQGGRFAPIEGSPVVDVRYLDVLPLPAGGFRIYYEARLPDESHELRTELIQP